MALPAGVAKLGAFQGRKGDTGTVAYATAETLPADHEATVEMVGPPDNRGVHFGNPRGLPGVNAVPTDEAVAVYLDASDTETNAAAVRAISRQTSTVNVLNYGAKGDGVTSDSAAIAAAVDAAPSGSEIVFPPGKTFRITEAITNEGKALSFRAYGAKFINVADSNAVRLVGVRDAARVVTSFDTSVQITEPSGSASAIRLTLGAGAGEFRRGDVVKLVANDVIPGSRDAGNGALSQMRFGQFFVANTWDGTDLIVGGTATDSFALNPRVARYPQLQVAWQGGLFDASDEMVATGRFSTIVADDLVDVVIRDVAIVNSMSAGVVVRGCFRPVVENITVGYARNDTSGASGHGVQNISSQGLRASGLHMSQVRHAYSDNSAFVVADSDEFRYHGRALDCVISGSIADSTTAAAYDTHTSSVNTMFIGCVTRSSGGSGFNLRGNRNVIVGGAVINCALNGVNIFTEGYGGEGWGHRVSDLSIEGARIAVQIRANTDSDGANYNVREERRTYVSGVIATRIREYFTNFENVSVALSTSSFEGEAGNLSSAHRFRNVDAYLEQIVSNVSNHAANATGNVLFINQEATSILEIRGMRVQGALHSRFGRIILNGPGDRVRCSGIRVDTAPTGGSGYVTTTVGGWFDWDVRDSGYVNGGVFTVSNPSSASDLLNIVRTREKVVHLQCAITTATTLPNLPTPPLTGVLLVIENTGTAVLSILHGGSRLTDNIGSATKTVESGETVMYLSKSGVWKQIA